MTTQVDRAEAVALAWTTLGHRARVDVRRRWPGLGERLDDLCTPVDPIRVTMDRLIIHWTTSPELRVHVGATWPTLSATLHRLATAT